MNPNEQENNVINQQVIQPQQPQTVVPNQTPTKPDAPKKPFKVKKKKNKMIVIILVVIVLLGGIYFFMNGNNGIGKKVTLGGNNQELIKVETGKKWGDTFALYLQNFYKELDKTGEDDKIEPYDKDLEIAFIDFDFDGTPEMLVKYIDRSERVTYRMFVYSNEEVSETKDFRNASFRIIYSLKDKVAGWYIYISNGNKTGAYTEVEKILTNTAYDSDIKAYTDKEIANFNKNYASADYKLILFKIEEKTVAEDFKNAVDKYDDNNKDINTIKDKLINDYANVDVKEEVQINNDPRIVLGEYTLEFGKYYYDREVYENGQVVGTEKVYITINRDWTATIEGKNIKYNIYGNAISLENGLMIKATENNKFSYGVGTGNIYSFEE